MSYDEPDPDYPVPQVLAVDDVALILGVTHTRVLALIRSGQLVATRLGREYMIRLVDLQRLTLERSRRKRHLKAKAKDKDRKKPVGYTKAMRDSNYRGRRRLP